MLTVLNVFPDALNINGDAQNAMVLAQRARWAGGEARVVHLAIGSALPAVRPDIVVVGSGAESDIPATLVRLRELEIPLKSWADAGVPMLAVGTGWELLAHSLVASTGEELAGLGIFPGRSFPAKRVSDDIVIDSDWGRLVGYENHARAYAPASGSHVLGWPVYGRGNSDGSEGERIGSSIGTHLRGPVLAKNPVLADYLLTAALGDSYSSDNETAARVDEWARVARTQAYDRLGLGAE